MEGAEVRKEEGRGGEVKKRVAGWVRDIGGEKGEVEVREGKRREDRVWIRVWGEEATRAVGFIG